MKKDQFTLIIFTAILLGCAGDESLSQEDYWTKTSEYSEIYLSGEVSDVKRSLWLQLRLDKKVQEMDTNWFSPGGEFYSIALCYGRLALINKAQGHTESSDSLFGFAIRYWNEMLDTGREVEIDRAWVMSKEMVQFEVDSLDYGHHVRWREILDFPPVLYYPKFQVGEEGVLELTEAGAD